MVSTILVVEDEGIVARDIQHTLQTLGYDVPRTAPSGIEALAAFEQIRPDLVLMDITLKGALDGIQTTAKLRERCDVPVIYLTAHSDDVTMARAKATNPQGYLLKPFNERDLRTAIEVALHKHELERQLSERERWFATTLESLDDAIIATNSSGNITFVNPAAETLTGWRHTEAIGKPLAEVFKLVDASGAAIESVRARAVRDRFCVAVPKKVRLVGRRGAHVDVDDVATAIVDARGNSLGGMVMFRDVTERTKIERRLIQSERLAAIGTMAAATAHEINNPLAAILGNVAFASERVEQVLTRLPELSPEELRQELKVLSGALSDANQDAERARRIVRDLKKFARAGEYEAQDILDLPDVLDAAIKLTENQLRHKAMVTREYGTTPFVQADEGQLVQVLTNILVNAADSIADGRASANRIRLVTATDDTGRAVIEISDTGCGIAAANLSRIFDPFFSTKPSGEGMGLGLSICFGIVRGFGGDIHVESEIGKGTLFRVTLPGAERPSEKAPTAKPVSDTAPRRGRVLVIDDDLGVGRMIERILRDGYDVTTESEPKLAIERVAQGEAFDVILCDVMMPDLTGPEVHAAIMNVRPELASRIVFLTGGAFSPRASHFLEHVASATLAKPFAVDALRTLVSEYVSKP